MTVLTDPLTQFIEKLSKIHQRILSMDIDNEVRKYQRIMSGPLLTVGSGGSFSAACYVSVLHSSATGWISKPLTPLGVMTDRLPRDASVLFLSASGRNRDIRAALREAIHQEVSSLAVFCTRRNTPLAKDAIKAVCPLVFEHDFKIDKEGFLAFQSLYASALLLTRVYYPDMEIPPHLSNLIPQFHSSSNETSSVSEYAEAIAQGETVLVLHSGWATPAAIDFESKCSEAALTHILLSDYRNFGHGRHFWLARRPSSTWLVTLSENSTERIVNQTLSVLPESTKWVKIHSATDGPLAGLGLLLGVFILTRLLSRIRGINLKRPGVPEFGRKLYHMNPSVFKTTTRTTDTRTNEVFRIILRKNPFIEPHSAEWNFWENAYQCFRESINESTFHSMVLDYDGTVCGESNRYGAPDEHISGKLADLLAKGVVIGIATGRGDSARAALTAALPESLWHRVIVGYLNGAVIAALDHEISTPTGRSHHQEINTLAQYLEEPHCHGWIDRLKLYETQISVFPRREVPITTLFRVLEQASNNLHLMDLQIRESSFSVDVMVRSSSKTRVLDRITSTFKIGAESTLCIGDKGDWPGNDFELLRHPYSLSVDETSFDPATCWNLSRPGYKGPASLMDYLGRIKLRGNGFRIQFN